MAQRSRITQHVLRVRQLCTRLCSERGPHGVRETLKMDLVNAWALGVNKAIMRPNDCESTFKGTIEHLTSDTRLGRGLEKDGSDGSDGELGDNL